MPPRSTQGRARTRAQNDPQESMFDRVIEDGDLIAALEARETARAHRAEVQATFKDADDAAKDKIAALEMETDEVIRAGRFRIKKTSVASREVAFETSPTSRVSISTLE
jgi:hypothetical protein